MVDESWRTLLQEVGAWIVPTSSVDSSGFVPIKSKFRQRTVRPSACSPRIASWAGGASVMLLYWMNKKKEMK